MSMNGTAAISDCGRYRYELTRVWDKDRREVVFLMLNPSTADALADDRTIEKCCRFARRWGWGGIRVYNLFAWRATDPDQLSGVEDPIGPENDGYIFRGTRNRPVVAAWGSSTVMRGDVDMLRARAHAVCRLLEQCKQENPLFVLSALVVNQDGHPRHPLYVREATPLTNWAPPAGWAL